MNLSIRRKVILGALASMVAGLAVAGVLAVRSVEQHELARTAETLEARTALVASALEPHLPSAGPALQRIVRELSRQGNARITVIGTDGLVAADSDTPDAALANLENHGTRPEVVQAWTTG
jgi:dihydrodipicolinate synthase/N-acetylneuraminate lyase